MESDEKELKDEEKEHAEGMKEDDDDKAEDENGEGDPFWFCGPPSSVLVKREKERLEWEIGMGYGSVFAEEQLMEVQADTG